MLVEASLVQWGLDWKREVEKVGTDQFLLFTFCSDGNRQVGKWELTSSIFLMFDAEGKLELTSSAFFSLWLAVAGCCWLSLSLAGWLAVAG